MSWLLRFSGLWSHLLQASLPKGAESDSAPLLLNTVVPEWGALTLARPWGRPDQTSWLSCSFSLHCLDTFQVPPWAPFSFPKPQLSPTSCSYAARPSPESLSLLPHLLLLPLLRHPTAPPLLWYSQGGLSFPSVCSCYVNALSLPNPKDGGWLSRSGLQRRKTLI